MSVIQAEHVSIRYITGDLKNIGLDDISSEEDTIRSEDVFSRY